MELEPETLPLWYDMIKALKSHAKYSKSVKETVSDVKVTDIFCDQDAVAFVFGVNYWLIDPLDPIWKLCLVAHLKREGVR